MADNNRDHIENSDLEINEIREVSGELFGNDDSNEEFNDYEMDSTEESDHEADIDMIDDTKWRNNKRQTKISNIYWQAWNTERTAKQPYIHGLLCFSGQIIILK